MIEFFFSAPSSVVATKTGDRTRIETLFPRASAKKIHSLALTLLIALGGGALSACSHLPASTSETRAEAPREIQSLAEAELASPTVLQGGVAVVRIRLKDPADAEKVRVTWEDMTIPSFLPKGENQVHLAMFGIPLNEEPGTTQIQVELESKGEKFARTLELQITERETPKERLHVKRKHLRRRGRALSSVRAAQTHKQEDGLDFDPNAAPLWSEGFTLPRPAKINSAFGSRRVYNGRVSGVHLGTDLQARTGDPVFASASGRVASAKRRFLTGNTVIIDHGMGIFTSYAHLSKIKVRVGELISDHTLIGLAGSTGRASGPHLHWGASIRGVRIDPMELLSLFSGTLAAKTVF